MHTGEDNRAHDFLSRLFDQNQTLLKLIQRQSDEISLMRKELSVIVRQCEELRQLAGKRPRESSADRRARLEPVAIAMLLDCDPETGLSRKKIARELGVSESTLRGWTGEDSFEDRLARAKAVLQEDRIARQHGGNGEQVGDVWEFR